jgi:hypothetical protein
MIVITNIKTMITAVVVIIAEKVIQWRSDLKETTDDQLPSTFSAFYLVTIKRYHPS